MAEKRLNIYLGASSLLTCLGNKSETLAAMERGESGLKFSHESGMYAGIVSVEPVGDHTRFESILIGQIEEVLTQSGVSLSDDDVLLIISTTKGNIALLEEKRNDMPQGVFLYTSALAVAEHFRAANRPVVISNACISGVSAFVAARQMLISGRYRHAVVAGADILCRFITSGFASFKSVSALPCRPYDAMRDGLTLGEAAGAVLLTVDSSMGDMARIRLSGGAVSNDANHISGPSRTGDGLYYAISRAMAEAGVSSAETCFANAHGTATRYNDEMESKAMALAGLDDRPLIGLKGYIGHTLGASGVVETIICAEQMKLGHIFGTKGYVSSDTPHKLCLSSVSQPVDGMVCIKTASGFGGCNAAIVLDRRERISADEEPSFQYRLAAGYSLPCPDMPFPDFIRSEFKSLGESNMKFYKMSDMCKALYVAVERLLEKEDLSDAGPQERAIILANRSASLDADLVHQRILDRNLPEGASPAAFVYTLANVAAGEMCIRHKIQGENTFFIEDKDSGLADEYARRLIMRGRAKAVICGWCEYLEGNWNVNLKLYKKK